MSSKLFSPIALGGLELGNRIVVAPMCQYSASDGVVGDWHLMHLGQFAVAGHGLIIAEATAVEAAGRISVGCPGLYNDEQVAAWSRVLTFCKDYGNVPVGVQLAHAGRKGATSVPWHGGKPLGPENGGWETVAPSAIPFADGWPTPRELSSDAIKALVASFAASARRADQAGFELIEIHAAHGYLLHQFLSPLSNTRSDSYGGSPDNRMRLTLEVFDAVRAAFPASKPVGVRISATDWIDGGWSVEESVQLAQALDKRGCDFIHVSSGGLAPAQDIAVGPGYQVEAAASIKQAVTMPVIAVGLIKDAHQAETIVRSGQADLIGLARGMLFDPHWTWRAAAELGGAATFPPQYERAHPSLQGLAVPGNPPKPNDR